jgi:hypothetical protein
MFYYVKRHFADNRRTFYPEQWQLVKRVFSFEIIGGPKFGEPKIRSWRMVEADYNVPRIKAQPKHLRRLIELCFSKNLEYKEIE